MRRRRRPGPAVPERLARFVTAEWPDAECPHEALDMWKAAAADWLAADSTREPLEPRPGADPGSARWWLAGGGRRRLPFGGALGLLREEIAYRRGMPACPGEYRPAVLRQACSLTARVAYGRYRRRIHPRQGKGEG